MDEELKAALEAMEGRLMARINGLGEQLSGLRADMRNLRSEHDTTRVLVAALPATVLKAVEEPLLRRVTAIEGRLDKLEKPEG